MPQCLESVRAMIWTKAQRYCMKRIFWFIISRSTPLDSLTGYSRKLLPMEDIYRLVRGDVSRPLSADAGGRAQGAPGAGGRPAGGGMGRHVARRAQEDPAHLHLHDAVEPRSKGWSGHDVGHHGARAYRRSKGHRSTASRLALLAAGGRPFALPVLLGRSGALIAGANLASSAFTAVYCGSVARLVHS